MRAVVQRCQHRGPRMHTLVTLGGQHQGVMNVPLCWNPSFNATPSLLCRAMQSVVGWGAYLPLIRTHLIQAQYFKVRCCARGSGLGCILGLAVLPTCCDSWSFLVAEAQRLLAAAAHSCCGNVWKAGKHSSF